MQQMSPSVWVVIRMAPAVGGLVMPGQPQQMQIVSIALSVPDGTTPENIVVQHGLVPFVYVRPAMEWEKAMFWAEHPIEAPAVLPEVFSAAT